MNFTVRPLGIDGPLIIEPKRFYDSRGFFEESFRKSDLEEIGLPPFVQENHSLSRPPVIRGMHYQLNPKAQGKLIFCVSGMIADVVIDIRPKSDTYGKWEKIYLCGDTAKMLYVPPGFAHGFLAFGPNYDEHTQSAHLIYKTTEYYDKTLDRSIRWNDPEIGIDWELDIIRVPDDLQISDKDRNAPLLKDADNNF